MYLCFICQHHIGPSMFLNHARLMIFSTSVILSPRIDIIYPCFGKIKVENRGKNKKGAFVKQNLLKKCSIFLPSKIKNI